MSDIPTDDNFLKKRVFELTIWKEEKLLNASVHRSIIFSQGPMMSQGLRTKNLVLNKSSIFRKWSSSCIASEQVWSLELLCSKANRWENIPKLVKSAPRKIQALHTDLRPDSGFNSFRPLKTSLLKIFGNVQTSISLSYFEMDGRVLSKVFQSAKSVRKVSLIRCCLEPRKFSVKNQEEFQIREICLSNCRSLGQEWQGAHQALKIFLFKVADSPLKFSVKKICVTGDSIRNWNLRDLDKKQCFRGMSLVILGDGGHFRNHQLLPI